MLYRLRSLITERAALWVRQVAAREAVGRPAAAKVGKPVEETHAPGRPALPGEPPSLTMGGAVEGGQVGRLGGVVAIRAPLPAHTVRLGAESGVGDHAPEA